MNQQMLLALAEQRAAELRESASASHRGRVRLPRQSLRVRTGWTLVGLGLRLVAQPSPTVARPASP